MSGAEAVGPGRPPAAHPSLPAGTEAMARADRCPVPGRVPAPSPCCNREGRVLRELNDSPGLGRQNSPTCPALERPAPPAGQYIADNILSDLLQDSILTTASLQGISIIP